MSTPPAPTTLAIALRDERRSRSRWRQLLRHPSARVGGAVLLCFILLAILAPVISGDPYRVDPTARLQAPSPGHWLGTDENGRDLWTVLVFGARTTIGVAAICTALASVIAFFIGIVCGYFPRVDAVIMRVIDGLMSFPNIILVLSLVGVMGPGFASLVVGLTVVLIPAIARVVRGAALSARGAPSIEAATAIGAKDGWILVRYIAPETVSVLIVQITLAFSATVLSIAALSFLGIGLPPDVPSWGASLSAAQQYISVAWWLGVFPGAAILLTVLALVLLGDALRDIRDPRHGEV